MTIIANSNLFQIFAMAGAVLVGVGLLLGLSIVYIEKKRKEKNHEQK